MMRKKRISVLVIAHNEEKYIVECLSSLLEQSVKPDEIILVAHNCSDNTLEIAKKFSVIVDGYHGPPTQVESRKRGFSLVSGDYILCLDGDSVASKNWVEVMIRTLEKGNVFAGSLVYFGGLIYFGINVVRYFSCVSKNADAVANVWGPSFGFLAEYRPTLLKALNSYAEMHVNVGSNRIIDDLWMAHVMSKRGNIEVTNKASVTTNLKEQSFWKFAVRGRDNLINLSKFRKYVRNSSF